MKIINKTPLVGEDGSLNIINRIRGTLQFGFSWYPDLRAQETAIALLGKILDNQFTLIRNPVLGAAKITFPLILVGPPGLSVIYVTHLSGMYRAKGDMWGKVDGGKVKAAGVNLLQRTAKLAKALGIHLRRLDPDFPVPSVDAVLMATNPGMHIASVRPIVRIVMSDAIERFALSLTQTPSALNEAKVKTLVEMILTGKKPERGIPSAGGEVLGMGDVQFDFGEDEEPKPQKPTRRAPARRLAKKPSSKGGFLGLTQKQLMILGILAAGEVCALVMMILIVVLQLSS